jgi:hypothetical protein
VLSLSYHHTMTSLWGSQGLGGKGAGAALRDRLDTGPLRGCRFWLRAAKEPGCAGRSGASRGGGNKAVLSIRTGVARIRMIETSFAELGTCQAKEKERGGTSVSLYLICK